MDGEKLARVRYAKGYTLRALAERSGVAFYTIWAIEQGRTKRPHPGTLRKLAAALGVEPEELVQEGKAAAWVSTRAAFGTPSPVGFNVG